MSVTCKVHELIDFTHSSAFDFVLLSHALIIALPQGKVMCNCYSLLVKSKLLLCHYDSVSFHAGIL